MLNFKGLTLKRVLVETGCNCGKGSFDSYFGYRTASKFKEVGTKLDYFEK